MKEHTEALEKTLLAITAKALKELYYIKQMYGLKTITNEQFEEMKGIADFIGVEPEKTTKEEEK